MATAASSTTVNVTWTVPDMPNGNIRYYLVSYYRTELGSTDTQILNTSSPDTDAQLSDLEIFTPYTVFVQAFTVALGERSDLATVVTDEDGKLIVYITNALWPI